MLDTSNGRARLRLAGSAPDEPQAGVAPSNTVRLSPRVRSQVLANGAIAAVPLQLIGPFLNAAVVLNTDELAAAPRVVATQEGRVMVTRGETGYVRGDLGGANEFRLFRESVALTDPETNQTLGHEARFLGTAEYTRPAGSATPAGAKEAVPVPATIVVTSARQEIGVGDRLSAVPQREFVAYMPHPPASAIGGRIVSIYGDAMSAGQNQIVAINRGSRDGVERGHVLALWSDGAMGVDRTDGQRTRIKLPDERVGTLFVFRVFDRVSYALIVSSTNPVRRGDRFSQP